MKYVILGDGGFAHSVADMLCEWDAGEEAIETRFTADDNDVRPDETPVIGLGDHDKRIRIYHQYAGRIPFAGIQIMRNAWVEWGCEIGRNVLVNANSFVDHDCRIGDHSVISPGCTICGKVTLGERCFIGAGTTIVPGVTLPASTFIRAGSLVVSDKDIRRPR